MPPLHQQRQRPDSKWLLRSLLQGPHANQGHPPQREWFSQESLWVLRVTQGWSCSLSFHQFNRYPSRVIFSSLWQVGTRSCSLTCFGLRHCRKQGSQRDRFLIPFGLTPLTMLP